MNRLVLVLVLSAALLAVVVLPGIVLAYNCLDTIKYDAYWGDPGVGVPGHFDDANLHCPQVVGFKYLCPPSKYPVNPTAEVGAIMVLEPNKCQADPNNGHVGIVVGVASGSIQVYEQAWGPGGPNEPPGTHSHPYPCDGMWFIHQADSDSDGIPDGSDNCPTVYNPDQVDTDDDGIGDVCDPDEEQESAKADFNGDGVSDLFHITPDGQTVDIWYGNPDNTFYVLGGQSPWQGYSTEGRWKVGDFNGDGVSDLFHITADGQTVTIWYGNPDNTFYVLGNQYPWSGYSTYGDWKGDSWLKATPTAPASVGGIAELPDAAQGDSSADSFTPLAGLAALSLLTLAAGNWYARRRRPR